MTDTKALQEVRHLVVNKRSNEPYDVYIGRYGKGFSKCFGNPFEIDHADPNKTRLAVVSDLESLLLEGLTPQAIEMRASLHRLKGQKVGCFCAPALCHGHVLAHHAASLAPGETLPLGGKRPRLTTPWIKVLVAPTQASSPSAPLAESDASTTRNFVGHSRYPLQGQDFLECSSQGDRRFSALNARLKDGRSIEEAYQLDVKGYRVQGNDWRLGKGKPPLAPVDLWGAYKALWTTWVDENPAVFADLARLAKNSVLTDRFASSPISQARALAELLSERLGWQLGVPAVNAAPAPTVNTPPRTLAKTAAPVAAPQGDLFGDAGDAAPAVRPRNRP